MLIRSHPAWLRQVSNQVAELVRHWINFGNDAVEPPSESDEPTQGIVPITSPTGSPMFDSRAGETVAVPVVRILVAYTELATADFPNGVDSEEIAKNAIYKLNEAFSLSQIAANVELAGTFPIPFKETGKFHNDLQELRTVSALTAERNSTSADIVVILVGTVPNGDNLCGAAFRNAPQASAYAVVAAKYVGKYGDCFSHEVGHIFGADHDVEHASSPPPFSYDHGLQHAPADVALGGCFRTIMAYQFTCRSGQLVDINHFSNPSVSYTYIDGRTNTAQYVAPTGSEATANNARVLNERAATVAAFRALP